MRDYGLDAHNAAVERLDQLETALLDEDDDVEDPTPYPDDMVEPFCGCQTCYIREVLAAAWPHLRLAARAEFADELIAEVQGIWFGTPVLDPSP